MEDLRTVGGSATPAYRILTLDHIAARGLERFPSTYAVGPALHEPDAILVRSSDLHRTSIPATVKAIGRAGAGTNNIPVAQMSRRGIPVFNAPGANANAVCELVLAALLLGARNLAPAMRFVERIDTPPEEFERRVEQGKGQFAGVEIKQRTLGVVGLGAIGSRVAHAASALGMTVIGYDPELGAAAARQLPSALRRVGAVDELVQIAEFVTLHLPLLPSTRGLIDEKRLALFRPGAGLLNFSRDAIVDEAAVVEAVRSARLAWYVCDFPSPRLVGRERIVALPHLGACTAEAEENCAAMVVDEVRDFLLDGTLRNAVNFPEVEMPRESPHRVAIANANVPNMLGQISSAMARAGLNIHDMVNKSRGDMAYTLVDLDAPADEALMAALAAIEGVLSVRRLGPPHD